jgi:hypothetical protein
LFIVVLALAAVLTRGVTDGIHAVRGTEPPHLAKARIRADQHVGNRAGSATPVPGRGTAADVWSAYWGGAMADIAAHRDRVRLQKQAGIHRSLLQRLQALRAATVGNPDPAPPAVTLDDLMGGQEPTLAPAAPLTPPPCPPQPAPPATPVQTQPELDVVDVPLDEPTEPTTTNTTERKPAMPNTTTAVATEVNNNDDARIALTTVAAAAAEAAEALSILEIAKAKLQAAANGTLEGMSGKRFDMGATTSAAAAAEAINVGDLAEWSEKFDTAESEARSGLRALDKYLDSEELIADNNVDATTLQKS